MRYIVFSLVFSILSASAQDAKFSSKECLQANFKAEVEHESSFFGLLKENLKISKDKCLLTIRYKQILEKEWVVDLCREPIHIKYKNKGSLTVYKKVKSCDEHNDDFCKSVSKLRTAIQDHGLIFASGAREKIDADHGKVYCSYLLLEKYLAENVIFSQFQESPDIYTDKKESCALPIKKEVLTSEPVVEASKVEPELKVVPLPVVIPVEDKKDQRKF